MLLGDTWLLTGDVVNWLAGRHRAGITFVLDQRYPRVFAALLAGAALAVAGTTVQAVCRNPLAEPGLLGITGGAGVGAVTLITLVPVRRDLDHDRRWPGRGAAAFALVYGLAWRGGLSSDRLVLIGIGVWAGAHGAHHVHHRRLRPVEHRQGADLAVRLHLRAYRGAGVPVAVALLAAPAVIALARRELDLLALDDDTPRVLGVRLERTRLVALAGAALLTSTAVSAIGVVGFVGWSPRTPPGPWSAGATPGCCRWPRCSARCWSASPTPSAARSSRRRRSRPGW